MYNRSNMGVGATMAKKKVEVKTPEAPVEIVAVPTNDVPPVNADGFNVEEA